MCNPACIAFGRKHLGAEDVAGKAVKPDPLLPGVFLKARKRDGGLTAFHDVLPHPRVPGIEVDRLWRELREWYEYEEFVQTGNAFGFSQWGGIGVLRYRSE